MISFLENQDLLSMQQFGLKSNGSASDLLLSMTTEWSKALEKGTDSHDIAGAFAKLRDYGVSGQYLPSCRLPQGKKISYCIKLSFLKWTSDECHCNTRECWDLWNICFSDIWQLILEARSYPTIALWRSLVQRNRRLSQLNTSITPLIQYHPGVVAGMSLLLLTRNNWCIFRGDSMLCTETVRKDNLEGPTLSFRKKNWDTWS